MPKQVSIIFFSVQKKICLFIKIRKYFQFSGNFNFYQIHLLKLVQIKKYSSICTNNFNREQKQDSTF